MIVCGNLEQTLAVVAPSATWSQKSASECPIDGRLAVVSPLSLGKGKNITCNEIEKGNDAQK